MLKLFFVAKTSANKPTEVELSEPATESPQIGLDIPS